MAKNAKWPVKNGYLKNFEEYLMAYNIEKGIESKLDKISVDALKPIGSYIMKRSSIVAVFRFENEYYMSLEDKLIPIPIGQYTMEIVNEDDKVRRFIIKNGSQNLVDYSYSRIKYVNFDAWSDEDDVDFLVWLKNIYNNGRLANMYK